MVALLLHRFVSFDVPFRDEGAALEQGLARTVPSRMRAELPKANVSPIWLTATLPERAPGQSPGSTRQDE
jgi:hypothetical protein